mgnify:CR=1 FL=1
MNIFTNLPVIPYDLASLIEAQPHTVASKSICNHPSVEMTLFAFAEGEGISELTYFGDTMYIVLDGEMTIDEEGQRYTLKKGERLFVPSGTLHAIKENGSFKMLQLTISNNMEGQSNGRTYEKH